MTTNRRTFLKGAFGAGLALPLLPPALRSTTLPRRRLDLLILGGTGFLGPAIVWTAVARGHRMTLFNRGRTDPDLFPELETVLGDRNVPEKLARLEGRQWDAVIDTSGYYPRQVEASAGLLADAVRQYVFVSTLSVYADPEGVVDEQSPVGRIPADEVAAVDRMSKITGENYGPLKALCEEAAEAAMPGRVTNVRPGLIVGPRDRSDRFTYWPARVARGGEVLAAGDPEAPVQMIDVHDLGSWIVGLCEQQTFGVYNAVGFPGPVSMEELLHGCKIVIGSDCRFTWADEAFLQEHDVRPWMGPGSLPLWIPGDRPRWANDEAIAAGLTFRPLGETIESTLPWHRTRADDHTWRSGLTPEREAELLEAWHARRKD